MTVRGPDTLPGVDVDLHDVGELTPTVAAVAALATRRRGCAAWRTCAATRRTASPRSPPSSTALGGDVEETADGLVIRPAPLRAGDRPWRAYADHRMATAGALVGLVVPGRRGSTTSPAPPRPSPTSPAGGPPSWSRVSESAREYDESDVRVRPGRGSRPRTKRRPGHADARAGDGDHGRPRPVDLRTRTATPPATPVTAMRARELGRTPIVVGDRVGLVGDRRGKPDTLARIVRVEERTTVLRRTADDTDPVERARGGQRRAARDRHGRGRPGAAHRLRRPVPGRRVRGRARAGALPDQGRPRRSRAVRGAATPSWSCR